MVKRTVTLYTRQACCLCDSAKEGLERVRRNFVFELAIVDLDREASADKRAAYDHEVPVIELDGRKVMKYKLDVERLVRLLSI